MAGILNFTTNDFISPSEFVLGSLYLLFCHSELEKLKLCY